MRGLILVAIWLVLAVCPASATDAVGYATSGLDPVALIRHIETQYQGRSSHGKITMEIKTRHWQRTLVMEAWSEGRDRFLTRILEPRKERGTGTLKVADDIWNYFPRIDRLVKIPSSMMGDRWMGSHLTNDDLVKEGKSIIMISSELNEILRMSDRIAVMCEGKLTGILNIEEATQERIMALATQRG